MKLNYTLPSALAFRCNDWKCRAGNYVSPEGIVVSSYSGIAAVEYLDYIEGYGIPLARYFHDIIEALRSVPGSVTLHAFPYDWRLPVWQYPWQELKSNIESQVSLEKKRAVLIVHSLGGIAFNWFLHTQVDHDWRQKHIGALISINGAFGGSFKIVRALMSGYNPAEMFVLSRWGLPQLISNRDLREVSRTLGSLFLLTPDEPVHHSDTPIISVLDSQHNYSTMFTLRNWTELTNDEELILKAAKTRAIIKDVVLRDPGVPTFCFWSRFDDPLTEGYYVYRDWDFSQDPEMSMIDGDGTLPMESLRTCAFWESTVYAQEIPNQDHMFILRSPELHAALQTLMSSFQ